MLHPLPSHRWTEAAAAHLLSRAGFGGTPTDIAGLHRLGHAAAVDRVLGPPETLPPANPPDWAHPDPARADRLRTLRDAPEPERRRLRQEEQREQRQRADELRRWWLARMVTTDRPLEEKLVLFWHGHFATSIRKVRDPWLMYRQLDTFRRLRFGPWPDLLVAVTRDPAMLLWLDQAQSRREHPNENYAREVLELFALGEGRYGETDILETARALTGLTLDRVAQEPEWRPRQHDPGPKTILGRTAAFGPDEAIRHIAGQPLSARHLADRLWRFFASERSPAGVTEGLAARLTESGGDFRSLLRALFLAEEFYAPDVVRTQIKSPVQWLVTALRQLERPLPPGPAPLAALRELGQELLAPPNVKGWDGGIAWINTATLTRRQQLAAVLVEGRDALIAQAEGERGERLRRRQAETGDKAERRGGREPGAVDRWHRLFAADDLRTRATLQTALERRFLQHPMRPALIESLQEVLGDDRTPDPRSLGPALRVVLASTDYQLT